MNCYMCEKPHTSVEHVPPRCFFPEAKDLADGVDLRKQLITVPACDDHNLAKSKDDEYLLNVLVIGMPANDIAKSHFFTKIKRAIERNPKLMQRIVRDHQPVKVVDEAASTVEETVALKIEGERVELALEHIARALHFHHFEHQWLGPLQIRADFLLASRDPRDGPQLNSFVEQFRLVAERVFEGKQYFGENPDVFKYQVAVAEGMTTRIQKMMRLHFYKGCTVSVLFMEE